MRWRKTWRPWGPAAVIALWFLIWSMMDHIYSPQPITGVFDGAAAIAATAERAELRRRLDGLERSVARVDGRCANANRDSSLTVKRVVWLRAMLHVMAHRHGRKLPRALTTWPAPALKGIK